MEKKTCSKCLKPKIMKLCFPKRKSSKDGYAADCFECHRKLNRAIKNRADYGLRGL